MQIVVSLLALEYGLLTETVFVAVIQKASEGADLVFVGMRSPTEDVDTEVEYVDYYTHLIESTEGLPPTAMVLAAEGIDYLRMLGTQATPTATPKRKDSRSNGDGTSTAGGAPTLGDHTTKDTELGGRQR